MIVNDQKFKKIILEEIYEKTDNTIKFKGFFNIKINKYEIHNNFIDSIIYRFNSISIIYSKEIEFKILDN